MGEIYNFIVSRIEVYRAVQRKYRLLGLICLYPFSSSKAYIYNEKTRLLHKFEEAMPLFFRDFLNNFFRIFII